MHEVSPTELLSFAEQRRRQVKEGVEHQAAPAGARQSLVIGGLQFLVEVVGVVGVVADGYPLKEAVEVEGFQSCLNGERRARRGYSSKRTTTKSHRGSASVAEWMMIFGDFASRHGLFLQW